MMVLRSCDSDVCIEIIREGKILLRMEFSAAYMMIKNKSINRHSGNFHSLHFFRKETK